MLSKAKLIYINCGPTYMSSVVSLWMSGGTVMTATN
jgi:hypothetical protein